MKLLAERIDINFLDDDSGSAAMKIPQHDQIKALTLLYDIKFTYWIRRYYFCAWTIKGFIAIMDFLVLSTLISLPTLR